MTDYNHLQLVSQHDLENVDGGLCYDWSRQCVVEWVTDIGIAAALAILVA